MPSSHPTARIPEAPDLAGALMQARQTLLPKRLGTPGPDAAQLASILGAAAHAPDHGRLQPWRFVLVPQDARAALGEAFAQALVERDAAALPEQIAQAREKAGRAPVLLLAVVDSTCGDPAIDLAERLISAGCAVQNMLLMATAHGFGSALTSGKAMHSRALRQLFALGDAEQALCFISVGRPAAPKPPPPRPAPQTYLSTLQPQGGTVPGVAYGG